MRTNLWLLQNNRQQQGRETQMSDESTVHTIKLHLSSFFVCFSTSQSQRTTDLSLRLWLSVVEIISLSTICSENYMTCLFVCFFLFYTPEIFFFYTWYNVLRKMDMRTYWKHNAAEDMQVVEYRAEKKQRFPVSLSCFFLKHLPSLQSCVFKHGTLSLSVAYSPAGRQSRLWFVGSFGIKSAGREVEKVI